MSKNVNLEFVEYVKYCNFWIITMMYAKVYSKNREWLRKSRFFIFNIITNADFFLFGENVKKKIKNKNKKESQMLKLLENHLQTQLQHVFKLYQKC